MSDERDDIYGADALDEITDPRSDLRPVADEPDLRSTVPADTDLDELRDGGPTRTKGVMTTTGGTAGPASVRRVPAEDPGGKVAPTTTGDAGSGGTSFPGGGSTSDATTDSVS
jgi:hypothetical protein